MTKAELKEVLDKHLKWLRLEGGGERADLRGADLCGADLRGAKLLGANLLEANLFEANLLEADLLGAKLLGAKLLEADLRGADLCGANLLGADLRGAKLRGADLRGANLFEANLREANLRGADLREANLFGADLLEADLREADLREANIELEQLNNVLPICCPEHGSFTAWKKVRGEYIVKLEVTEAAKRSSASGRKCRCSEARVLAIETEDGRTAEVQSVSSKYDKNFVYRVGGVVKVENFDGDRRNECAPGIHFFITRQEAVNYKL